MSFKDEIDRSGKPENIEQPIKDLNSEKTDECEYSRRLVYGAAIDIISRAVANSERPNFIIEACGRKNGIESLNLATKHGGKRQKIIQGINILNSPE
jgi:hypothetical protein